MANATPDYLEHVTVIDPLIDPPDLPTVAEVLNAVADPRSRQGRRQTLTRTTARRLSAKQCISCTGATTVVRERTAPAAPEITASGITMHTARVQGSIAGQSATPNVRSAAMPTEGIYGEVSDLCGSSDSRPSAGSSYRKRYKEDSRSASPGYTSRDRWPLRDHSRNAAPNAGRSPANGVTHLG